MKNKNFKLFVMLKAFILIAALSTVTISCDNEEMDEMNSSSTSSTETLKSANSAPKKGEKSIAQIAIDGGFTELVGALAYVDEKEGTSLVNLFLNGKDQYTVFAPTNKAFENLYMALKVKGIRDLDSKLVLNVLQYHVVEGRRAANSVVPTNDSRVITTLLGATFSVNNKGQIQAVGNTATIAAPNISASNGIIHVVDAVLLPIKL
ncbi:fasciclin domain-containing protein [Flavobacterium sp. RSSA_27]|uniref:fasciclin domain-containing protein n=1 Tax=Flavobacterium sp. RSSA_27 TaxID=3447667 RepID=UPI003F2C44BF